MHRSRLPVLVIFAAVAACSSNDDSEGTAILTEDHTLLARLEIDRDTRPVALPASCGAVTLAVQPAVSIQAEAKELTRQAQSAQMQGNMQEASSLLRRAFDLDGTNMSAAYHLGRTSEALGDRTLATKAYCRYLALSPSTAESAEASERVAALSKAETRVAAGSVTERAPTPRRVSGAQVRRATGERPAVSPRRLARSTTASQAAAVSEKSSETVSTAPIVDGTGSDAAGSDVASTQPLEPVVDQPSTAPSAARRGPSQAQGAAVGAAAGAIIGAATGRSVKSAVIGAAAGGLFGTMVVRGTRPVGRGIRP